MGAWVGVAAATVTMSTMGDGVGRRGGIGGIGGDGQRWCGDSSSSQKLPEVTAG